ncbi:MAG: glycosyl transferase family 1, partial [Rhodothermales bacterium]|nr:glycosyl transferase family 1 [Rhodothermales bacterium]
MDQGVDIAFAMAGDVHRNARALRQLGALADAGLTVDLFCLPGSDLESSLPQGVRYHPLKVSGSGGIRFFRALAAEFARALGTAEARLYHAS